MFFIEACKNGINKVKVIENTIPKDAKFIRSFTDDLTGWGRIGIVIESESFEELKDGDVIPIHPDPQFENVL